MTRKVAVAAEMPDGLKMYGEHTLVREKILMGVYGAVSKVPDRYRNDKRIRLENLPPLRGKISHLVPLEKKLWTTKDKVRFVDESDEKFSKDIAIQRVEDVTLEWTSGVKPAMQALSVYVNEEKLGELRLYAGVLVHIDKDLKEWIRDLGHDNMVLFSKLYPYSSTVKRMQRIIFKKG